MHKITEEKTLSNIISKFLHQADIECSEREIYDKKRNKYMLEIRATQLIAAIERKDLTNCSILIKSLIKSSIKCFPYGWTEKPYGLDDLDHGSYGAITSAICSLSLIKSLELDLDITIKNKVIKELNNVFDTFYFFENKGHIVKNLINKSKVFNTDLLVALATVRYLKLLPQNSIRKRLFLEMCFRFVNNTISSQLPNGAFRYHELSLGVPFLYQAMCSSLLFTLSNYISHPYIYKSAKKGALYLLKNYESKKFLFKWNKANCNDKAGSIWIYGWIPNILDTLDRKKDYSSLINHLENVQLFNGSYQPSDIEINLDPSPDKFYSALMLFALSSSERAKISKKEIVKFNLEIIYDFFYFLNGILNFVSCFAKQFRRKLLNKFLPLGALENEKW